MLVSHVLRRKHYTQYNWNSKIQQGLIGKYKQGSLDCKCFFYHFDIDYGKISLA